MILELGHEKEASRGRVRDGRHLNNSEAILLHGE